MKKIIQLICLSTLIYNLGIAQEVTEINGKNFIEQPIEAFTELELNGAFNIYLTQGEQEKLYFEDKEKFLDNVRFINRGNRLIVEQIEFGNRVNLKKIKVYVVVKDLDELELNGVGKVRCVETLNLKDIEIEHNGARKLALSINAKKLSADFNGIGGIKLSGDVTDAKISMNGIGKLDAYELKTKNLEVSRDGIGRVEVNASNRLYVSNNGIGNIRYKGNPNKVKKDSGAIGTIKAR